VYALNPFSAAMGLDNSDAKIGGKSSSPSVPPRQSLLSHFQWQHMVAGVSGGVISTLILHPLDLIKIRFQVNEGVGNSGQLMTNRPQYTGLWNAGVTIARQNGIRGLYQGVTPNVWGAGSAWGLYFLGYNALKARKQAGNEEVALSAAAHMLAATQAGFFTLLLTNPIWVAKTRMCLQYDQHLSPGSVHYRGMVDCLRKTYQFEGIRGLYKGFLPGVFGVSHGALQFMAYEELKKTYNSYRNVPSNTKFGTVEYLCFAALSKVFAATATYPYQVVRARLQDQHRHYNGVVDVIRQTFVHEGLKGFYKGLVPVIVRVTPACCLTFVTYETLINYLLPVQVRSSNSVAKSG